MGSQIRKGNAQTRRGRRPRRPATNGFAIIKLVKSFCDEDLSVATNKIKSHHFRVAEDVDPYGVRYFRSFLRSLNPPININLYSNFDLSVSSRRDFKGSLREGAPAERVEEHAQQTLVRLDMASASRLYRRLLPSPCGATSLSVGGLYCDRKQDGESSLLYDREGGGEADG